jgi:hypothetical protein
MLAVRLRAHAGTLLAAAVLAGACSMDSGVSTGASVGQSSTTLPTTASTSNIVLPPPRPRATTPTLPVEPEVFGTIGETVRAGDIEVTVHDLRFDPCGDTEYEALPGNTFAVVTVEFTMTRAGGDTGFLGPLTWSLADNDGMTYTSVASCHDAGSGRPPLEPGSTVVTEISFEIPGTAEGLAFAYYAGSDTDEQTVIVDLGE